MKQIKVKLIRSRIGATPHQRKMLDSLGLRKLNNERVFNDTPSIRGIVNKLPHLVELSETLEEIETPAGAAFVPSAASEAASAAGSEKEAESAKA